MYGNQWFPRIVYSGSCIDSPTVKSLFLRILICRPHLRAAGGLPKNTSAACVKDKNWLYGVYWDVQMCLSEAGCKNPDTQA